MDGLQNSKKAPDQLINSPRHITTTDAQGGLVPIHIVKSTCGAVQADRNTIPRECRGINDFVVASRMSSLPEDGFEGYSYWHIAYNEAASYAGREVRVAFLVPLPPLNVPRRLATPEGGTAPGVVFMSPEREEASWLEPSIMQRIRGPTTSERLGLHQFSSIWQAAEGRA